MLVVGHAGGAAVPALAARAAALGAARPWQRAGADAGGRLLRRSADAGDRPALFAAQFALCHACWLLDLSAGRLARRGGGAGGDLPGAGGAGRRRRVARRPALAGGGRAAGRTTITACRPTTRISPARGPCPAAASATSTHGRGCAARDARRLTRQSRRARPCRLCGAFRRRLRRRHADPGAVGNRVGWPARWLGNNRPCCC